MLLAILLNFWAFLSYRDAEWSLVRFVGVLAIPGALYFIAAMLVPDDPRLIESWRTHYFDKRVPYFSGIVAWGLLAAFNTTLVLGLDLTHPSRATQLAIVTVGVCGLASTRPIVHQSLVVLGFLGVAMGALIFAAVVP
jgi:hypothetical protein